MQFNIMVIQDDFLIRRRSIYDFRLCTEDTMNIEQINTSRILISLCDKELREYDLTYETMDLKNEKARKVIMQLLSTAEDRTGIPLCSGRVMIEAMKYDHGCILLVTLIRGRKGKTYRIAGRSSVYAFFFGDSETMLCCMEQLSLCGEGGKTSSLYLSPSGGYILICNAVARCAFVRIAGEYADAVRKGRVYCAALREKCRCLARGNAVKVCCGQ